LNIATEQKDSMISFFSVDLCNSQNSIYLTKTLHQGKSYECACVSLIRPLKVKWNISESKSESSRRISWLYSVVV